MPDKALILGINNYRSVSGLRGCVNDANNMRRLLTETLGFSADNVRVFTDEEVVKSRLRQQLTWLLEGVSAGDRVALHFSGHGSYTADADEEDERGFDELLCLHDMDFDRPASYFLDDELRRWTKRLPKGANLTVFLDNCHSGTGTRLLIPPEKTRSSRAYPRVIVEATAQRAADRLARSGGGAERAIRAALEPSEEEQVLARFVDPPPEVVAKVRELRERGGARRGRGREAESAMNHVLLAAARDDQTAADAFIEGDFHGAFTFHLCKILREAGRDLDRAELHRRLSRALQEGRYSQVPQLEPSTVRGPLFAPIDQPAPPLQPERQGSEGSGVTETFGSSGPETTPGAVSPGGAGAPELFREFLRTCNRLIDLMGRPSGLAEGRERAVAGRHVVYVHGIGTHTAGFSQGWFDAMMAFTPSLLPGTLGGNRHEVLWSNLVNARALEAAGTREVEAQRIARELRATVEDRVEQQRAAAAAAAVAAGRATDAARVLEEADAERDLTRGALDGLGGIDDFARYLADSGLRDQVIARFTSVVGPLLRGGAAIEIIAHSWGTVVAYEGLRRLDRDGALPAGAVRNFFTVGSALSIPFVRHRLLPEAADGARPRLVRRWLNLDAQGDPVGGRLAGSLRVDQDFLELPAVGCGTFLFFPPNPVCAHSSYFDARNGRVNRDIFGRFIEGA
jgi:hypothetical protein